MPFGAYTLLVASSLMAFQHAHAALFVVAASLLILLLVGIHNAWDAVTYNVFVQRRQQLQQKQEPVEMK
jgi:hypothetical protein